MPDLVPTPMGMKYQMPDGSLVDLPSGMFDLAGMGAFMTPPVDAAPGSMAQAVDSALLANGTLDPSLVPGGYPTSPLTGPGPDPAATTGPPPIDEALAGGPNAGMSFEQALAPPQVPDAPMATMDQMFPPIDVGGAAPPAGGTDAMFPPIQVGPPTADAAPGATPPGPEIPSLTGNFNADLDASMKMRMGAEGDIANADMLLDDEVAKATTDKAVKHLQMVDAEQAFAERSRAQAEADLAQLRSELEDIKNTQINGDPTQRQVLGNFIGAIAQGFLDPHGESSAVGNLHKIIERNIAVQKANLDNRRSALQEGMSLAQSRRLSTLDHLSNMSKIRLAYMEAADDGIEAAKARWKAPAVQARLKKTQAEVFEAYRSARAQHDDLEKMRRSQNAQAAGQLKLARDKFDHEVKQDELKNQGNAAVVGTPMDPNAVFDPSVTDPTTGRPKLADRFAGSPSEIARMQTAVEKSYDFARKGAVLMQKMAQGRNDFGGRWGAYLNSPEGKETMQAYAELRVEWQHELFGSALTKFEIGFADGVIPPTNWLTKQFEETDEDPTQLVANFTDRAGERMTAMVRAKGSKYDFRPGFNSLRPPTKREQAEQQRSIDFGETTAPPTPAKIDGVEVPGLFVTQVPRSGGAMGNKPVIDDVTKKAMTEGHLHTADGRAVKYLDRPDGKRDWVDAETGDVVVSAEQIEGLKPRGK